MTETGGSPEILKALGRVAADMGKMDKQKVLNYQAFLIDDIYSRIRPLLVRENVIVIPSMRSVDYVDGSTADGKRTLDARVLVDYTFHSTIDGSWVTMTFGAEGRDLGDKATNKAVQQAFKYGLIQMFQISTGEIDPDQIVHDPISSRDDGQVTSAGFPFPRVTARHLDEVTAKQKLLKAVDGDVQEAARVWGRVIDSDPSLTPEMTLQAALQLVAAKDLDDVEETGGEG